MVELFSRRPHALHQRNDDGRTIELHRVAYLSGNGARCASHEGGLFTCGCDPGSIFAINNYAADIRRTGFANITTDEIKGVASRHPHATRPTAANRLGLAHLHTGLVAIYSR